MALLFVFVLGVLVAGWLLTNWHQAFVLLFPMIYFEDMMRKAVVPGKQAWPMLLRDGIVCLLYLACLADLLRRRGTRLRLHPLVLPYLAVAAVALLWTLHPDFAGTGSKQFLLPALGVRNWLFYVPMTYVACRWLADFERLQALSRWLAGLALVALLVGAYEIFIFLSGSPLPDWLGPVTQGEDVHYMGYTTRGADTWLGEGTQLLFAYSTFSTFAKYAINALFAFAVLGGAYCFYRRKAYLWGWVAAAMGLYLARGRSVIAPMAAWIILGYLAGLFRGRIAFSAKWLKRLLRRMLWVGAGLGLVAFAFFKDILSVLYVLVVWLDPTELKDRYDWHFKGFVDQVVAMENWWGQGTGTASHGSNWVTGEDARIVVESGISTPYAEWGIVGLVVYSVFFLSCLAVAAGTTWRLKGHPYFASAFLLAGCHISLWAYWFKSYHVFGDSSAQLCLWISLGFVIQLGKLAGWQSNAAAGAVGSGSPAAPLRAGLRR